MCWRSDDDEVEVDGGDCVAGAATGADGGADLVSRRIPRRT